MTIKIHYIDRDDLQAQITTVADLLRIEKKTLNDYMKEDYDPGVDDEDREEVIEQDIESCEKEIAQLDAELKLLKKADGRH